MSRDYPLSETPQPQFIQEEDTIRGNRPKKIDPPSKGGKSIDVGMNADKETRTLSPYLSVASGRFTANASGNISKKSKSANAELGYNKGGFSAGVGFEKNSGNKPNMTANISYSKKF